jgi:hypothetical protein
MVPYVSFVIYSRNDDYAGGQLRRMEQALNCLLGQLREYALDAEIVIVDWNPPDGHPTLADAVRLDEPAPHVSVRFIEVPERYHRRRRDWERKGMCGVVANNVGIRRARGRFILPRTSDTLFSSELIEFLARRELREDRFYRCNRVDTSPAVFERDASTDRESLLDACRKHAIVEHGFLQPANFPSIRPLHTNGCGDFTLASREAWRRIRGSREWLSVMALDVDGLSLHALASLGLQEEILPGTHCVYKVAHDRMATRSIVSQPMPDVFAQFEERLIEEVQDVHKSLGEAAQNLGDPVRFGVRLVFDLPRRTIGSLGDLGHPCYAEYLYRVMLLSSSRSPLWKILLPRNRKLQWQLFRRVLKVYRHFRRLDPVSFSSPHVLKRVACLLVLAMRPRLYRMNGPMWGLAGVRLPEHQL